jgi:glycine dehydrogenase subunit 2
MGCAAAACRHPRAGRHGCCAITCSSQETLGNGINIHLDLDLHVKYGPKVNGEWVRSPKVADLHPLRTTTRGAPGDPPVRADAVPGLSRFTLQPGGGSQG